MVRRAKGLSLIEILVASSVAAVLLIAVGKLFTSASRQVATTSKRHALRSALSLLSGHLQKFMATGDVRFLAFSPYVDKPLVRFLLPLPGLCGDLSSNCAQDFSLLFAHYDKSTHPSVVTVCAIGSDTWLVDLNNMAYGAGTFDVNGFQINGTGGYASGKIPVESGKPLALFNAPIATIWIASGTPSPLTAPTYTAATQTLNEDGVPLPADCGKNGTNLTVAANLAKLYKVKVTPYVINQFSVAGTPAAPMALTGAFPLRMFPTEFRTVGKRMDAQGKTELAITRCSYAGSSTLDCTGSTVLKTTDVTQLRLEAFYSVRAATNPAVSYELLGSGMTLSPSCEVGSSSIPTCTSMSTSLPLAAMTSTSEDFQNLNGSLFSLLKQESLSKLRFKLTFTDKEEKVDVIFNN